MKRAIKLTESTLNKLVDKVLKEQEEQQFGTMAPNPEEITGSPEDESGEPNFDAFIEAANELLSQGLTIGDLVDKICESQEGEEPEPPEVEPPEPEEDQGIPSDNQ